MSTEGTPAVFLDHAASEPRQPFGIITADCSAPHEIDDGIAVQALDSDRELYKVSVFVVDASRLYLNEPILRSAYDRTESVYHNIGTPVERYEPMIPTEIVMRRHFSEGRNRAALVVEFIVGEDCPPGNVDISFGHVRVEKNYNYKDFGDQCLAEGAFEGYGRAAAYILSQLQPKTEPVERVHQKLVNVGSHLAFKRGSDINQTFMVAANSLVARVMTAEERLAIYRIHDPADERFKELLDKRLARYSATPGPHEGLGLEVYTRVTSPLRRVEDLVMHGLLKLRDKGLDPTGRDRRIVDQTVLQLNLRIGSAAFGGSLRTRNDDEWPLSEGIKESAQEVA